MVRPEQQDEISMSPGYYWALIKHTGEIEIVEIGDADIVFRMGDEMTLELSQIVIVKSVPPLDE
jgi:hypothetical protein